MFCTTGIAVHVVQPTASAQQALQCRLCKRGKTARSQPQPNGDNTGIGNTAGAASRPWVTDTAVPGVHTACVAQQALQCLLCNIRCLHIRHCSAYCAPTVGANNDFAQPALQCLLCNTCCVHNRHCSALCANGVSCTAGTAVLVGHRICMQDRHSRVSADGQPRTDPCSPNPDVHTWACVCTVVGHC